MKRVRVNAPTSNPGKRFAGGLLIAIGGMIFLMCGLCTVSIVGAGVDSLFAKPGVDAQGFNRAGWGGMLLVVGPIIGGIPTIVGLAILALGVSELRGRSSTIRGPILVGGALMTASAAVAWVVGGVLVALILQTIKYHTNGGASFGLIIAEIVLGGVVLIALTLFWKGLKMIRTRAPEK